MKYWKLFAAFVALCLCAAASAQDLKPVRDRDSKLFGYQDKSKNWVIPPSFQSAKRFNGGFAIVEQSGLKGLIDQSGAWVLKPEYDNIGKFDKSGLCEVTVKADRVKRRGLADQSGRLVIPVECYSISVDRREGLILAEKDVEVERLGVRPMWGVYDMQGEEIFAPQFSSAPSFSEGRGTATSAYNSLKGIISTDGQTLLPFNNLAISSRYGGYSVLTSDFVREVYDSRLLKTEDYAYAGYVRPYDPAGDPVRAAAWRVGAVGHRLSRNNLKEVRMNDGYRNRSANCSDLRLDWGYDRFVRLEPAVDEGAHPGSMLEPNSGLYYTVKAILYEKDGTPVGEVSRWGWFEGECEEGIIYNAEGAGLWMAMRDLNCPAVPAFSTSITGYRTIDHGSVLSGLGLSSYELDKMYNPETAGERYVEIITGENLDIILGGKPLADEEKEPVKAGLLKILKDEYGIEEEDLISAEIEAVPAGKARDFGLDRSMIMGYGHDDRVCAFAELKAMLELKGTPEYTCCGMLVDKEEIGSVGATGMKSNCLENAVAEILDLQGAYSELNVRRALRNSRMLSCDVSAGFDPLYAGAYEKKSSAGLGRGVCFNKFTGSRGKSGSNDANAEYMAKLRRIMDENKVCWQTAELGKVDQGGGGTIAYICALYGMEVSDSGVAVLNMHAPMEVISKADLYEAMKAYKAFMLEA